MINTDGRPTIASKSSDVLLALVFEQEKQEKLLRAAELDYAFTALTSEAAHDPLNDILRDMNYGGERALTAAIAAVEAAAEAGLLRTVEECLCTFRRIRDGLAVHES